MNAASQAASSQTGEPVASTRGSTGEVTPNATNLESLSKELSKLCLKKERLDHHIAFLSRHLELNTTPKGLKIYIQISVPDYRGSALESSIRSLQEEVSKRARDLVLEHYKSLAPETSKKMDALKERRNVPTQVS